MTRQRTDLLRTLLGAAVGGMVLFGIHLAMNPVPIAAGPAFVLGMLGFLRIQVGTWTWVVYGALAGTAIGLYIHRGWHIEGSSPPPAEGLWPHLAMEGAMGLGAAAIALGAMALVMRLLESR